LGSLLLVPKILLPLRVLFLPLLKLTSTVLVFQELFTNFGVLFSKFLHLIVLSVGFKLSSINQRLLPLPFSLLLQKVRGVGVNWFSCIWRRACVDGLLAFLYNLILDNVYVYRLIGPLWRLLIDISQVSVKLF
jgi:hypothetical protein